MVIASIVAVNVIARTVPNASRTKAIGATINSNITPNIEPIVVLYHNILDCIDFFDFNGKKKALADREINKRHTGGTFL
ncbi:hypothetical protein C4561_03435 [candidate division WWE3 bacterium]|uniref:Uncharacterized protein n=1 Tax=candidate division WWE3 bacterium TaxID=2053526 RepID=A0A3A4ZCH6_UNCKA|nr:MAG: hypothetical protein C4561_03435 [candidate division WWE3 bacterium]